MKDDGGAAMMKDPAWLMAHMMLHRLWSKAVGTQTYNKGQWLELERVIDQLGRRGK